MKPLIVVIGVIVWLAWPTIGKEHGLVARDGAEQSLSTDSNSPAILYEEFLRPSQDTYVAPGVGVPTGHLEELIAGHKDVDHVTLVQFELPDRGPDARVISARLELYCITVEEDPDSSNKLMMWNVVRKWDEDVLTRTPRRISEWFDTDIEGCDEGGEWKTIEHEDLLKIVNMWYTGAVENYGLAIGPRDSDSTLLYRFVASNGEPPPPLGKGPRLIIEFSPITGVPSYTATATDVPPGTATATDVPPDTATTTAVPPDTATAPPSDEPEPAPALAIPAAYNNA